MKNIKIEKRGDPKSIIVNGDLHGKFKMLCKGKSMKIGAVVEDLISLFISDPKRMQNLFEELKGKGV
jgi:5'-deoxynucleotidase YfbR-like HD superfamily hydrolase